MKKPSLVCSITGHPIHTLGNAHVLWGKTVPNGKAHQKAEHKAAKLRGNGRMRLRTQSVMYKRISFKCILASRFLNDGQRKVVLYAPMPNWFYLSVLAHRTWSCPDVHTLHASHPEVLSPGPRLVSLSHYPLRKELDLLTCWSHTNCLILPHCYLKRKNQLHSSEFRGLCNTKT